MRVMVTKLYKTVVEMVDYVLKEKLGGQLLMCNVGIDIKSIISYFEGQVKEFGKNSISCFIVAQHCNHKISIEKWIEIWHDIFLELKIVDPKYLVGKHNDGSQAHCHGLVAQFRPEQYLFDEEFRSRVPNVEYNKSYKKNKNKLEPELLEIARKLEVKHQLPALSISIHYTREHRIPEKFRFKGLMRDIIDKSIASSNTMEQYLKELQKNSKMAIHEFKIVLIENKKFGYLKKIENATEMTFEAKEWCDYENVFKIGDFKCRGFLLGPEYAKERIKERIIQNSEKPEAQADREIEIGSQQENGISESKSKGSKELVALELAKDDFHDFWDESIDENVLKIKLEFSLYDRLLSKSIHTERNLVGSSEEFRKSINERWCCVRDLSDREYDKKYKFSIEPKKSIVAGNNRNYKKIELIEVERLLRSKLYEEYVNKINELSVVERNNQLLIHQDLRGLKREMEIDIKKYLVEEKLNQDLINDLGLSKIDQEISVLAEKERHAIASELIKNGFERILRRNGYVLTEVGGRSRDTPYEWSLHKMVKAKDYESLKEIRDMLIRVNSLLFDDFPFQSIESVNSISKQNIEDKVKHELELCRVGTNLLSENSSLRIHTDLLIDTTDRWKMTIINSSVVSIEKLILEINSLIYIDDMKDEIINDIKLQIGEGNKTVRNESNIEQPPEKRLKIYVSQRNHHKLDRDIDEDKSHQQGSQLNPSRFKRNGKGLSL